MQSSATTACRAMVMLICLVVIPLAAVFGTTLPNLVGRLLDGRFDLASVLAVDTQGASHTSRPFQARHDTTAGLSPRNGRGGGSPLEPTSTVPSGWPASPPPPAGQKAAIPASHTSPANPARASAWPPQAAVAWTGPAVEPARWGASGRGLTVPPELAVAAPEDPVAPQPNLVPVAPKSASPTSIRPVGLAGASDDSPAAPPELGQASGQFAEVERQLRELGARYYLLETWGARAQYYRFHARMGMGSESGCIRYFEATDPDPLQAMVRVLDQVRCWRDGQ